MNVYIRGIVYQMRSILCTVRRSHGKSTITITTNQHIYFSPTLFSLIHIGQFMLHMCIIRKKQDKAIPESNLENRPQKATPESDPEKQPQTKRLSQISKAIWLSRLTKMSALNIATPKNNPTDLCY